MNIKFNYFMHDFKNIHFKKNQFILLLFQDVNFGNSGRLYKYNFTFVFKFK